MRDLILGLARPLLRLLGRDERGAVAVLVGVLIGGGVLLGMGALVLDVGTLYQERAELQNGADAAALAVARSCANGICTPAAVSPLATGIADKNASSLTGHLEKVDLICGPALGIPCPASDSTSITNCPPNPVNLPAGVSYVDVHTSTLMPNGSTLLPPVLARTLLGNGSYRGTDVGACAQAEWGPPGPLNTIAYTISACTWDQATNLGKNFGPAPPFSSLPTLQEYPNLDQVLRIHTTSSDTSCKTEPAGADAPGVFGWTVTTGNPNQTCTLDITGTTYGATTGTSVSQPCADALAKAQNPNDPQLLYIPVYVGVVGNITSGNGGTAYYTLKEFAAFVVTGYNLPGAHPKLASDWLNPANNCRGNQFCINGYFTQALVPAPPGRGTTDLGLTAIALTG